MVYHLKIENELSEKDENIFKKKGSRKKFHSCSRSNKKFRRPCEVKEHKSFHKSTTPFVCKYCGKKLKSKTGAIYHTSKIHKIDPGNGKKLDEHFYIDANRYSGNFTVNNTIMYIFIDIKVL